jgi:hypothetical protein
MNKSTSVVNQKIKIIPKKPLWSIGEQWAYVLGVGINTILSTSVR